MVADTLANAARYAALHPGVAKGLEAVDAHRSAPAGRYPVDGEDVFLLVQEYHTRPAAAARWETHREYLDIQVLLAGEEHIGRAHPQDLRVAEPYHPESDSELLEGPGSFQRLRPDDFAIFYPGEPHMPGIAVDAPAPVRKMVIKVRVRDGGGMAYSEAGGMRLSKMMLGTVQLGMPYGIANRHGQPSREEAFALLDAALAGGVNCLDTARQYGSSEQVLGQYLAARPHSRCTVVTKFKIDPARGTTPQKIERQLEEYAVASMQRLGLDALPIYLAHNADDITRYGSSVSDALRSLRRRGMILQAGVSVYDAGQIDAMLQDDLYRAVQLPLNVFDQRLIQSGHLERLHRAGCMVFVRSVFLQGLFFMESFPPGFAQAEQFVRRLRGLADGEGIGVAQLALAFVRDLPGVTSLVLGAETAEQVRENIWLMNAPRLSQGLLEKLSEMAAEIPIESIMEEILSRK